MQTALKRLPSVKRTNLVDEVIAAIQTLIGDEGDYVPGTRLPSEAELARQLGVGRSTVREALRVLTHLGLVEPRSGLGTYIVDRRIPDTHIRAPLTLDNVQHIYEFRFGLEVSCARLAAERRSRQQMDTIRDSWAACRRAVETNSADEFARLDAQFHFAIVKAAANPFFIESYERVLDVIRLSISPVLQLGPLPAMLHFHDELVRLIEVQDAEGAVRAVEENFAEARVRLRLLLDTEDR
jgi:GntR family transcriptional regulator, transcriptional repressor for pyruvate dehydrogenase complex